MSLNLEQANGGNFVLTKAGLAIGSTPAQLSTANSTTYVIDGNFQTAKGATATFVMTAVSAAFPNTVTVPIGNKCAFGVWLDSAGNFTVTQGPVTPVNSNSDLVGPPPNPGARAFVGYLTVYNASVSANGGFRPLTDALNTAGLTVVYVDSFSLPAKNGL